MLNVNQFIFFGTSIFSVGVLNALKENSVTPSLIITAPDRPRGRGLNLTPPPVKIWAQENKVSFLQPEKLDDALRSTLYDLHSTLFIVASYGKILPKIILDVPKFGTLNVHPSLLPKLRGASPIQSTILDNEKAGVTIMLMDEKMDHGPIVAQKEINIFPWPPKASELEKTLAREGGGLLAGILPQWLAGEIKPREQNHLDSTYSKKFIKEDGLLILSDSPLENYRKIQAFDIWPKAYFFAKRYDPKSPDGTRASKHMRVVVTDAEIIGGKLILKKVIPEGKNEMIYEDFLRV